MVLMWGFILEVFPTSPNKIGLKFPIHLNCDKSLELIKTGLLFPDGKGIGRAEEKGRDSPFPFPTVREQAFAVPSGAAAPVFAGQGKALSLLRLKLFSLTLDCQPNWVQARAGGKSNATSPCLILTTS